jgi:hypothetical protein
MRLTKKERAAIGTVAGHGIDAEWSYLLRILNCEGGYNFEEPYTSAELDRITLWIWKKLGLEA